MNICSATTFVVFGGTGDLMGKKIVPALWYLFRKGRLPADFRVVGVSRREYTDAEYKTFISGLLAAHTGGLFEKAEAERFVNLFSFQKVAFDAEADYNALADALDEHCRAHGCCNRVLYMAVPPELYTRIFEHEGFKRLVQEGETEETHTRVIVEKPFGIDEASAKSLEALLAKHFSEEQICRVDHYLAKDMLQNIFYFRFKNDLFEKIWNAEHVASITIRTWETLGVEHRGSFYDPLGALRDVGQNHLFEMLALIAMERPEDGDPDDVRAKRADVIKALRAFSEKEVAQHTFRAQYDGYQNIKGVRPGSDTETYYRLMAFLDTPRWKGVPITMEAGKRLHEWRTEIIVSLKNTANRFVFRTRPKEEILVYFESKKPGILEGGSEQRTLSFSLHENDKQQQYVAEYARMILDAIAGDRALFVGREEVAAAWRFIDPVIAAWRKNLVPLASYKPDSNEVVKLAEERLK